MKPGGDTYMSMSVYANVVHHIDSRSLVYLSSMLLFVSCAPSARRAARRLLDTPFAV